MYVTDISHPLNSARTRAPMQMGMSAGLLIGPALGGRLDKEIVIYSSLNESIINTVNIILRSEIAISITIKERLMIIITTIIKIII